LPYRCDGDGGQPIWRVSGVVGAVRTRLVFDDVEVEARQLTIGASAGRFATPRFGVTLSVGALVAGTIDGRDLGPGAQAAVGVSWLARREQKRKPWPFVLLTGTFAGVHADAEADDGDASYTALDGRIGVAAGKTFRKGKLTAYATARAFGGPVWWRQGGEAVTGSDAYHVTVGAGLTYRVPGVLDVGAELMPLGEQSATASVTFHF
jgi:hypothetical protein